jgi:hypothetical protein
MPGEPTAAFVRSHSTTRVPVAFTRPGHSRPGIIIGAPTESRSEARHGRPNLNHGRGPANRDQPGPRWHLARAMPGGVS